MIEAETAATRYRLRAVRDRWIPRLQEALTQVEFVLEEQERADGARPQEHPGEHAPLERPHRRHPLTGSPSRSGR